MLVMTGLGSVAWACGGFFCGNVPVDQQGEDILFAVDPEQNETTVHVQITYQGKADDFAWILPVPTEPELELSTDGLFRELGWRTQPRFNLHYEEIGECDHSSRYGYGDDDDSVFPAADASTVVSSTGGVTVVSQSTVGPYETVTLQANTSQALLDWLGLNGFNLPPSLDPVLSPYIAEESYFVALKLRTGEEDVGALQPLALTYPGTGASIPIQLTSIAATPDMRLHVYVLGQHRAVPDSYLHVKINDLVVNWWEAGANYEQVITVAADEAGGQAFATDFAGPPAMEQVLWSEGRYDLAALAASPDAYTFFNLLLQQGFVGDSQMLALFREFLPLPAALAQTGVSEQDFYNCLQCYSAYVDAIPFDPVAFAAAIDERVVTPMREAQELLDKHPSLTRLTSSVSPIEMTVDPTFVFNPDMAQTVSLDRSARLEMYCLAEPSWVDAPRALVLADGRKYELPPERWFDENNLTEYEYLQGLMDHYAIVIEDTSSSGEPVVLADWTDEAFAAAQAFNDRVSALAQGCGCQTSGPGAWTLLVAGLVFLRRR
jgi:MYXO-CTERM domain-containing protein